MSDGIDATGSEAAPRRPSLAVTACLAVLVALAVAHALSFWHHVNDDAYITFRYAARLAAGEGPYFNPGERVEGYSNLLLLLLSALVIALGGPAAAAPAAKALGVGCGALAVVAAFGLARMLLPRQTAASGREAAGLLAAGLVAVSPGFALNSTSGLETTLFAACLAGAVARGSSAPGALSGLLFTLANLTRPEGPALFAVFWLARLVPRVRAARAAGLARMHRASP